MHKTQISEKTINDFIKQKFNKKVEITKIDSGEYSQALILKVHNQELILRLNSNDDLGFQKDKIISEKYSHINSAKIVEIGKLNNETYFSISEKLSGNALRDLSNSQNKSVFESLFKNMNLIHSTKVEGNGFGNWYLNLEGQFTSWKERMDTYLEKDQWQELSLKSKFVNLDLLQKFYDRYLDLIQFIPEQRYFLHGDFGRTNIFAESNKITGIIDWSEAMYGDFLWDLCWIAFWAYRVDFIGEYYKFNKSNNFLDFSNFEKRIELYKIVNAIHHILFAAKKNDIETYKDILLILNSHNFHD